MQADTSKDEVLTIEEKGKVEGFIINGKKFYTENKLVDVEIEDLEGFNISSIPEGFLLHLFDGNCEWFIHSDTEKGGVADVEFSIHKKYWDHKFGASEYISALDEAVRLRSKTNKDVSSSDIYDYNEAHIALQFSIFLNEDMLIDSAYSRFQETFRELEGYTERLLEGENISSDVLKDEKRFVFEVLMPLFMNMGFLNVQYNHGTREFGKDVTFSEIDKFGLRRNYGVQAKVGDFSGEAGSEIDKIIGQINDAFPISYIDTASREERHISDLIIAISGRFKDNAKDKIIKKINIPNVHFFDIDKIKELLIIANMKKR